jgi:hypothetical protein
VSEGRYSINGGYGGGPFLRHDAVDSSDRATADAASAGSGENTLAAHTRTAQLICEE